MDGSKIKTFVICLLAAVNLIFLSLVITDSIRETQLQRQVREDLQAILRENGVELATDILPDTSTLPQYNLNRDLEAEAAMAALLLGPVTGSDQGGNIYYYETANGWARFRGNGEFEIALSNPLQFNGQSDKAALDLLKELGLEVLAESETNLTAEGLYQRSYTCAVDGLPVYNCQVILLSNAEGLISISGRRPIGEPARSATVEMNPATALLLLLSHVRDSGNVFSAVTGLSCGYAMESSLLASAELHPVWIVETDAGTFYINASSFSVESV